MHCLHNWIVYIVYYKTVLDTHYLWLVLYCLVCFWYANFIVIEYPIVGFILIVVWKFKTALWSEVSRCLKTIVYFLRVHEKRSKRLFKAGVVAHAVYTLRINKCPASVKVSTNILCSVTNQLPIKSLKKKLIWYYSCM